MHRNNNLSSHRNNNPIQIKEIHVCTFKCCCKMYNYKIWFRCGQWIKGSEREICRTDFIFSKSIGHVQNLNTCTLVYSSLYWPRTKAAQYVATVRVYLWMKCTAERWEVQTEKEVMIQSSIGTHKKMQPDPPYIAKGKTPALKIKIVGDVG